MKKYGHNRDWGLLLQLLSQESVTGQYPIWTSVCVGLDAVWIFLHGTIETILLVSVSASFSVSVNTP